MNLYDLICMFSYGSLMVRFRGGHSRFHFFRKKK